MYEPVKYQVDIIFYELSNSPTRIIPFKIIQTNAFSNFHKLVPDDINSTGKN